MPLFIKRLSKVSFYSHAQNYEMGLSVKNRAYPMIQCHMLKLAPVDRFEPESEVLGRWVCTYKD